MLLPSISLSHHQYEHFASSPSRSTSTRWPRLQRLCPLQTPTPVGLRAQTKPPTRTVLADMRRRDEQLPVQQRASFKQVDVVRLSLRPNVWHASELHQRTFARCVLRLFRPFCLFRPLQLFRCAARYLQASHEVSVSYIPTVSS